MSDEQFAQFMLAMKELADEVKASEQRLTKEIRAVRADLIDSFSGMMDSRDSVYDSLDQRVAKIEKVFNSYGTTQ